MQSIRFTLKIFTYFIPLLIKILYLLIQYIVFKQDCIYNEQTWSSVLLLLVNTRQLRD